MLLLNLVHASAAGFPLKGALVLAVYKELYVIVCLLIPVMALAAATAGMTELVVLAGTLIAVFARTAFSLYGSLVGADSCPTCDTGVAWLQHLLQHIGILFGAVLILGLQYYRRATRFSRVLAIVGALVIVFAQLPWKTAFAIQQSLSPEPGAAAAIEISFELQTPPLAEKGASRGEGFPIEIGQATRALLHGYAGDALKYLQSRKRSGKSPRQDRATPYGADGISKDEVLLVDHSQLDLSDDAGARMYRGVNSDVLVFRTVAPS